MSRLSPASGPGLVPSLVASRRRAECMECGRLGGGPFPIRESTPSTFSPAHLRETRSLNYRLWSISNVFFALLRIGNVCRIRDSHNPCLLIKRGPTELGLIPDYQFGWASACGRSVRVTRLVFSKGQDTTPVGHPPKRIIGQLFPRNKGIFCYLMVVCHRVRVLVADPRGRWATTKYHETP